MKRQRNRGRGGGGGGKPQHNTNRAFDSNGPDGVKVRGAAQHVYEKYQQLARDASSSGDRVLAENYLQHAEHYFRVLRAMQPQRPVGEIIGRDQFASGFDIDFEEEPPAQEETPAEAEADGANGDGRRDERSWQRDDRQARDDYRQRDDRQSDYRQRDERPRDERPRDDRQADYRPRDDRPRDDRYQGDRRDRFRDDRQGRYQGDRPPRQDRDFRNEPRADRDPLSVIEPQATPLPPSSATFETPPPESSGEVLRGEDGAMSQAPAFLQARSPEPRADGDEGERRTRRRRPPRSFEAGETSTEVEDS